MLTNVSPAAISSDGTDDDGNGGGESVGTALAAAAAAATLWMDFGDMMASGTWISGGEEGKLRFEDLPFKQWRAAS